MTRPAARAMLAETVTIEIRPVSGYADLERFVAARNEVRPDDPDTVGMMALVRATELEHVDVLAFENDEVVGAGMLAGDPRSIDSSHPFVDVTVPARHRGRGVGSALLRELAARARRLGKDGVECEARADDAYSVAFLERRGFVEAGRAAKFVLELTSDHAVEPDPPAGIELTVLADRPDLLEGMYELAALTYPELGGYLAKQAETFHEWRLYELGSPNVVLDMTTIALAGNEVVGFATLNRQDGRSAEHRMVAVDPARRRRGIATALVRAQVAAAAAQGSFEELVAWERSPLVGDLYTKLGYETRPAMVAFRGPLL